MRNKLDLPSRSDHNGSSAVAPTYVNHRQLRPNSKRLLYGRLPIRAVIEMADRMILVVSAPSRQSCGYVPRKNANRAERIEWEHVVPAAHLGSQRQCWQEGGRKNCSGKDPLFDMMEGDLNNLVPAVGEVNGDRGDMSYGAWTKNPEPVYGQCTSLPDFKNKRFQPREEVRGRAARISLYMHTRYGLNMSNQDKKLWCAWAKTYPVDGWEKVRNERIIRWQGR